LQSSILELASLQPFFCINDCQSTLKASLPQTFFQTLATALKARGSCPLLFTSFAFPRHAFTFRGLIQVYEFN